jgi:undecaprenyl-diphosphatase
MRANSTTTLDSQAPSRRHRLALGTAASTGVALLSALVARLGADEHWPIDRHVRAVLQTHGIRRTRAALDMVGKAGTAPAYLPAAAFAAAIVARRRDLAHAAPIVMSVAAAVGASWVLKRIVRRNRPLPISGPPIARPSFPSGHATRASAAGLVIAYVLVRERILPHATIPLVGLLAAAVGISRAYADAHWTTDVIGGWALGGATAAAGALAYERVRAADTR